MSELGRFVLANKKWWLIPLIVASVLLILLVAVSATPLGPFIYTVF